MKYVPHRNSLHLDIVIRRVIQDIDDVGASSIVDIRSTVVTTADEGPSAVEECRLDWQSTVRDSFGRLQPEALDEIAVVKIA